METQVLLKMMRDLEQWREHECWSRSQMEYYQNDALRSQREYAYAHSPFYQRFHKGLLDAPLQELPVLTQAAFMENFDDFVTDRKVHLEDVRTYMARQQGTPFLNNYRVTVTSGAADHSSVFYSIATNGAPLSLALGGRMNGLVCP